MKCNTKAVVKAQLSNGRPLPNMSIGKLSSLLFVRVPTCWQIYEQQQYDPLLLFLFTPMQNDFLLAAFHADVYAVAAFKADESIVYCQLHT